MGTLYHNLRILTCHSIILKYIKNISNKLAINGKLSQIGSAEILIPVSTVNTAKTYNIDATNYRHFIFVLCNDTGRMVYQAVEIPTNLIIKGLITAVNVYVGNSEIDFSVSPTSITFRAASSGAFGLVYGIC